MSPIRFTLRLRAAFAAMLLGAAMVSGLDTRAHEPKGTSTVRDAAPAAPRLVAESDTFELVGVLEAGDVLRLWLDRWADNAPVRGARVELAIGATTLVAAPAADGIGYVATLATALPEGVHPVTVTISSGTETDLLAGELDVHGAMPTGAAHGAEPTRDLLAHLTDPPRSILAIAVVIALAAGAAATLFFRARRARRSLR